MLILKLRPQGVIELFVAFLATFVTSRREHVIHSVTADHHAACGAKLPARREPVD
jgi:hypothetical protein